MIEDEKMKKDDLYIEAKRLAENLRKEKLESYAERIIFAMESGSTGTEIIMALRWHIIDILKNKDTKISKYIKNNAIRLCKEIDNLLK